MDSPHGDGGDRKSAAKPGQPWLIVIGTVVSLRGELSWFEVADGE